MMSLEEKKRKKRRSSSADGSTRLADEVWVRATRTVVTVTSSVSFRGVGEPVGQGR